MGKSLQLPYASKVKFSPKMVEGLKALANGPLPYATKRPPKLDIFLWSLIGGLTVIANQ